MLISKVNQWFKSHLLAYSVRNTVQGKTINEKELLLVFQSMAIGKNDERWSKAGIEPATLLVIL